MRALVVYDGQYGNTEQVAKAVAGGIGAETVVNKAAAVDVTSLGLYNLIVVGSATQGGRQTQAMQTFLDKVPAEGLKDKKVAAFDTRLKTALVKMFGYAAGRIEKKLAEKGGAMAAPAEGFVVKGAKGPLLDGELDRAAAWGKALAAK